MTEPDDRELEQYLKGGSKLSQRYREASGEGAPPELDEAILAQARAEVARKRRPGRPWFSGLALAASLVLAVNLGWNVYHSRGANTLELRELDGLERQKADDRPAKKELARPPPAAPAAQEHPLRAYAPPPRAARAPAPAESRAGAPAEPMPDASGMANASPAYSMGDKDAAYREEAAKAEAQGRLQAEDKALAMRESERRGDEAARAKAAPMSESQKIDRLVAYIAGLQGATFIRNGSEYGAVDAAKHLQLKRESAGDRVKTADDFIRYCASYSSRSGETYLIRFADGRTRTTEDVLREELARINAGG